MNYLIYNKTGEILRTVECSPTLAKIQVHDNEFILEGTADDATQKIVNGEIVDKTPKEIEAVNPNPPEPEPSPYEKRTAHINNEQWQDVLKRLNKLETRSTKNDE